MKTLRKNLSVTCKTEATDSDEELSELSLLIRQTKLQNRILQKITDKLNDPNSGSLSKKTK